MKIYSPSPSWTSCSIIISLFFSSLLIKSRVLSYHSHVVKSPKIMQGQRDETEVHSEPNSNTGVNMNFFSNSAPTALGTDLSPPFFALLFPSSGRGSASPQI